MPDLPPPPMPAMCERCGEPVTPYTVEVAQHNRCRFDDVVDGNPTHIPTRDNGFYFSCGLSRR